MVIVYFLQLETRTGDDCHKRGAVGTARSICGLPIKKILLLLAKCAKTVDELLIGRSRTVTLMPITYSIGKVHLATIRAFICSTFE